MVATRPPLFQLPPAKVCRVCGQAKPPSAFARRTKSADGLQRHCKDCGYQMLAASAARRKAQRAAARLHLIVDYDGLADTIRARADEVVDELFECAEQGAADVVDRLANVLCSDPCPADAEDWAGPDCLPHALAEQHANILMDRVPAAAEAMSPRWQAPVGA